MRYTQKFVATRFKHWAADHGLSTEAWSKCPETNRCKANVGAVTLDHNSHYGGYVIHQMVNEGGGVRCIPSSSRMKASELIAFFEGCEWALRQRK